MPFSRSRLSGTSRDAPATMHRNHPQWAVISDQ